jgi:phosphatidylglycerophosphate synthase
MAGYEPISRRPIADAFRLTAQTATRFCVNWNIHPDTISYLSLVAALGAALCFWKSGACYWLLLVAPLLCYLRLWFNMLDGMVALAAGKASWRGEILNDLPDRISDVVIFAGVAHSGLMNPILAYWAAIFAVLTAYVGVFGQAVGVRREFSGIMSTVAHGRAASRRVDNIRGLALERWFDGNRPPHCSRLDLSRRHRWMFADYDRSLETNHDCAPR